MAVSDIFTLTPDDFEAGVKREAEGPFQHILERLIRSAAKSDPYAAVYYFPAASILEKHGLTSLNPYIPVIEMIRTKFGSINGLIRIGAFVIDYGASEEGAKQFSGFTELLDKASDFAEAKLKDPFYFCKMLHYSRYFEETKNRSKMLIDYASRFMKTLGELEGLEAIIGTSYAAVIADERAEFGINLLEDYLSWCKKLIEMDGCGKVLESLVNPEMVDFTKAFLCNESFRSTILGTFYGLPTSSITWSSENSSVNVIESGKIQTDAIKHEQARVEAELLVKYVAEIIDPFPCGIGRLLDLGCGDGTKTGILLDALLKQGKIRTATIYLLDANWTLPIEAAINISSITRIPHEGEPGDSYPCGGIIDKFLKKGDNALKLVLDDCSFEQLPNQRSFKKFAGTSYVTLFLGTTFCNADPKSMCRMLKKVIQPKGFGVVGLYLYDEGEEDNIVKMYDRNLKMRELSENCPRAIGLNSKDISEGLDYRVEMKTVPLSGMDVKILSTYFNSTKPLKATGMEITAGTQIPGLISIKYTDEQAKRIFETNGLEVVDSFIRNSVGLYVVRKACNLSRARYSIVSNHSLLSYPQKSTLIAS